VAGDYEAIGTACNRAEPPGLKTESRVICMSLTKAFLGNYAVDLAAHRAPPTRFLRFSQVHL